MVSQNLGDSAFSGALWPRSFDSLSGNLNKGETGAAGKVRLLRPPFVGQPPQSRPPGEGPSPRSTIAFRQEDWPVTPAS